MHFLDTFINCYFAIYGYTRTFQAHSLQKRMEITLVESFFIFMVSSSLSYYAPSIQFHLLSSLTMIFIALMKPMIKYFKQALFK
jgi:hypothetical protein